jgi:hypothetical protein
MSEKKYTRIFDDEDEKITWTYDLDFYPHGPISVDIKAKKEWKEPKKRKKVNNGKKVKNLGWSNDAFIQNETPKRGRPRKG